MFKDKFKTKKTTKKKILKQTSIYALIIEKKKKKQEKTNISKTASKGFKLVIYAAVGSHTLNCQPVMFQFFSQW